jgi:murein DD-endopeptidase MepM/ murein hydrolase activator NlpD
METRTHLTWTWIPTLVTLATLVASPDAFAARNPDHDGVDDAPDPVADKADLDARGADADVDELEEADLTSTPVEEQYRLSSRYGWRISGRTGRRTFHAGVDFNAPTGSPVAAARTGTVVLVTRDSDRWNGMSGYGNAVVVYHKDEDLWTLYAHLSEVVVKPGVRVEAGQLLGSVGRTSNGRFRRMGAHLHFEVRERTADGEDPYPGPYRVNNIDPRPWLSRHGVVYDRRGRCHYDDDHAGQIARSEG